MKKRVMKLLGLVCAICLIVGSFAFFTDRTEQSATATAGNIDLVFTDTSLASEGFAVKDDIGTRSDIAPQSADKVWENKALLVENGVLNPGDTIDMDYKLENQGNKSIDVKQQIVLDSSVAITEDAKEYTIIIDGQDITPVVSNEGKTLTYELAQITLAGTVENDGIAIADGATYAAQEYDVAMAFARLAENKFMDSTVEITLNVQAKQHRNTTDADWAEWATYETEYEVAPVVVNP